MIPTHPVLPAIGLGDVKHDWSVAGVVAETSLQGSAFIPPKE